MMKKRTLTTAAVAVALTMTLSGLPLTASAALGGLPEVSTVRQTGADSDYDSEKAILSADRLWVTAKGLKQEETSRSSYERLDWSFQKLSGVDTLFDFTLTKVEQHTFTIDAKVSGEAKLVLTQDNKTATTLWEDGDEQKTTKTLTLQPGRWRVRLVCTDAGGNLSVTVDEPKSLFTHTRERAQKAYDAIMEPAQKAYEQAVEKAYDRYDNTMVQAGELYVDAGDEAYDRYDKQMEQAGEFERASYLDAEDGKEQDREYNRRYSRIEREYDDAMESAQDDYDELKDLADGYLQDRLNKAREELEQAQAKAEQAWDEIVG